MYSKGKECVFKQRNEDNVSSSTTTICVVIGYWGGDIVYIVNLGVCVGVLGCVRVCVCVPSRSGTQNKRRGSSDKILCSKLWLSCTLPCLSTLRTTTTERTYSGWNAFIRTPLVKN